MAHPMLQSGSLLHRMAASYWLLDDKIPSVCNAHQRLDHIRFDYFIGSLRNAKVATATIRPDGFKDGDMTTYRQQLIVAVARLPGVISASFAGIEIPVGDTWNTVSLTATDSPADATRVATLVVVSPEFFRTWLP